MFVWEKNLFLYHFWVLKETFRIFILNVFPKSYQYCFLGVRKSVLPTVFPVKSIKFSFSISQKCGKISISSEIFLTGKMITVVARWTVSVILFPDEGQIFSHPWTLNKKNGFLADFLSAGLSKLQSTCPHGLFNELCFMDFFLFWSLTKSVQPCGAFFESLVEAAFRRQKGTFEEKIVFFLKLVFFWLFWESSKRFWVFCIKIFSTIL